MKEVISKARRYLMVLVTGAYAVSGYGQQPVILSVDKTNAAPGEIITLRGSSFGTNAAQLSVRFGAAKAEVVYASDQLLEVRVPPGATFDRISVANTATGRTGYTPSRMTYAFGGVPGITAADLEGQFDFDSEGGLYDLCLCDFDNDGRTDIVTSNGGSPTFVNLFANTTPPGDADISFDTRTLTLSPGAATTHVVCGDLNGDGRQDIVLTSQTAGRVYVFRNTSAVPGQFTFTQQFIPVPGAKRVSIADLDMDGRPEIILSHGTNSLSVLVNQSNATNISFRSTPFMITIPNTGPETVIDAISVDDLNGDHVPEIVTSQFLTAPTKLFVIRNNSTPGTLAFGDVVTLGLDQAIGDVKTADLDGDDQADIVVSHTIDRSISIVRNTSIASALTFAAPHTFTVGQSAPDPKPWGLSIGDVDGDGRNDVVVNIVGANIISILRNESTPGNLHLTSVDKPTLYVNRYSQVGDVNGDGKPDIVFSSVDDATTGIQASKVSIFRNTICLEPQIGPEGPHDICAGFSMKLSTTPSAGTTYEWHDGTAVITTGPDAEFEVTASGNYTVTALSEGGACSLTSNVVQVTVGNGTTTGTAVPTNNGPICIGSTLELDVNDVGGTEYRWTGPAGYTATGLNPTVSDFAEIRAGRYQVDVIVNGCVAQQAYTVVEAVATPNFTITTTGPQIVCPPETMTLTVTPNPGTFSFQWFREDTGILAGETSNSLVVTEDGEYYVEASYTPNPACLSKKTTPVTVTFADAPVAEFEVPETICRGQQISFTNQSDFDPGLTPSYAWTFGDGGQSTDRDAQHTFATAATFQVKLTVSYENGACANQTTKSVTVKNAPALNITTPGNVFSICEGDTLILQAGGAFTSFAWNTGATGQEVLALSAGSYTVEATTADGCVVHATETVTLLPSPEIILTADPPFIPEGESTQLLAVGGSSYIWEPAESLSDPTIPNPVASPVVTTVYTVYATGSNGCITTEEIEVMVEGGSVYEKLSPSRFFSPGNGDDIGSFWRVEPIEQFPGCTVMVFDIKGVKVFEAKPYNNDWDGTFNAKPLPDGVYYYIIRCEGERQPPKTGSITILR